MAVYPPFYSDGMKVYRRNSPDLTVDAKRVLGLSAKADAKAEAKAEAVDYGKMSKPELVKAAEAKNLTVTRAEGEGDPLVSDYVAALQNA